MTIISKAKSLLETLLTHKPVSVKIVDISESNLLKGRTALITGGTGGIGRSIAKAYIKSGARVIITSRDLEKAIKIAEQLGDNSICRGMKLDLTNPETIKEQFYQIIDNVGWKIDILVNNAGVGGGDFSKCEVSEFEKIIKTNLEGIFFLSRYYARELIKDGSKGNILMIASSSSIRPAISAYAISKWGLRGLTKGLGKMLINNNIVVNGIAPGPTATPMLGRFDYEDIGHDKSPIGRYILPEEVANMATILVSQLGETIVGNLIYMTGGLGNLEISDISYSFNSAL